MGELATTASAQRLCQGCQRYTFDAMRCAACKGAYYCSRACQERDWTSGGHRLWCTPAAAPAAPVSAAADDE